MLIAAYSLVVATIFALLYVAAPEVANALTLLFFAAVIVPAVAHDWHKRKERPR